MFGRKQGIPFRGYCDGSRHLDDKDNNRDNFQNMHNFDLVHLQHRFTYMLSVAVYENIKLQILH